ncbi:MAG: hypothetical protein LBT78_03915 [Tannerella sp.]|jgi:hypothetical protein|nr:hypothetical protein [Tannerella sp.]
MELSLSMRIGMVEAQKEAAGQAVKTEHLFLGILALSKKNATEITKGNQQQQALLETDIEAIQTILGQHRIHTGDATENLRALLRTDSTNDSGEVQILLGKAVLACERQGKTEVNAPAMLEVILESPTPLIKQVLLPSTQTPPKKDHHAAETVLIEETPFKIMETVLDVQVKEKPKTPKQPVQKLPKPPKPKPPVQEPPKPPAPEPPKQEEPPKPPVPKAQGQKEPVFIQIPNPNELQGVIPISPKKQKRRTKINGITFRGGAVWAAIQYYFWGLLLFIGLLALLEYQWHALSAPGSKFMEGLPRTLVMLFYMYVTYGIISLTGRRFPAFAIVLSFFINLGLFALCYRFNMMARKLDVLPVFEKICCCLLVLFGLFYYMFKTEKLKHEATAEVLKMGSSMFRLSGTTGAMYGSFFLRSLILPLLVVGTIWSFGLSVNAFWRAAFFIWGFVWIYDCILTMFRCNLVRYNKPNLSYSDRKKKRLLQFLSNEWILFFLPLFGLFLMWYFNWFPMQTWVVVLYIVYGVLWLFVTIALIISKE